MHTKEALLQFLKKNRNQWISGEQFSAELKISRAAVSKQVKSLRSQGYDIESASRKGYRMRTYPDLLLPAEIQESLKTRVFGKRDIHYFDEIDSTHTRAKYLAEQGAPEGTLVVAENQTQGRGRRGRQWHSAPGEGIYVSLILRPSIPLTGAPRITLMTAVAAAEAIRSRVDLDIRIKWPNDILVHNKKMVGILTEISTDMDAINYILVGLGLNINSRIEAFPPALREIATSIRAEIGRSVSRVAIFRAFLEYFEKSYDRFKRNDFHHILRQWKTLSHALGQEVMVDVLGQRHYGKILDVDEDGVLILKDENGAIQRIISGDVFLCREIPTL